ncbi:hypothetical protein CRUP_025744, partial [Coryphaenoides rupestris]
AFFCGRSDYFKALLEDHFSEGEMLTSQPDVPVLTLHNISSERLCGGTLAKMICEDNVLQLWKTAKLFRLSRLGDQCKEWMAKSIEK